jgi:hypothetical protein
MREFGTPLDEIDPEALFADREPFETVLIAGEEVTFYSLDAESAHALFLSHGAGDAGQFAAALRLMLRPNDLRHVKRALDLRAVNPEDITDLVIEAMRESTPARPTEQPSDSTNSPARAGRSSTAGSRRAGSTRATSRRAASAT